MASRVANFSKPTHSGRQYQRILAAVFLSLIFHTLLLMYWQKPQGKGLLNSNHLIHVTLMGKKGISADEDLTKVQDRVKFATDKVAQVLNTQILISRPMLQKPDTDSSVPHTAQSGSYDDKGGENLQIIPYGMVLVFLTVAPSGNVKAITWTQLPPISEEKLQVLEALLRDKTYLASGTQHVVRELVEIGD